jgi:NADPH:quinone reductase-like Zn-dependent oxidoreductase
LWSRATAVWLLSPGKGAGSPADLERIVACERCNLRLTEVPTSTWADAPVPYAGPGQVRIAVRAASVNPIDWKRLAGVMSGGQPLAGPEYLGSDAAGVVEEVGEGATGVSAGDDVFGRGQGIQAESAVLDAWAAGETSERGLRLLGVRAGDTLFVDGGAGGVGAVAVQMALARGATVIASAGQANQDYLREIRAIPCGTARAWPPASGPRPAGGSTRCSTLPARPRSMS